MSDKPLVDDLASVLARSTLNFVGITDELDMTELVEQLPVHPEIKRVMARYRASKTEET